MVWQDSFVTFIVLSSKDCTSEFRLLKFRNQFRNLLRLIIRPMHLRHLYRFRKRLFGLLVAMRFLQRAAQLCFQARALRNKRYRCPCLVYRTLGHALLQQHRYLAYVALRRRKRYVIIPAIN